MPILRVTATGNGRKVKWRELCSSTLVDSSLFAPNFTTVLTDVVADVIDQCRSLDAKVKIVMISPNSFNTTNFTLALAGKGYVITCSRRLVRGWLPLNPIAAEFGFNYDVYVTLEGAAKEVPEGILSFLTSKYEHDVIA
jgi:hypothetical protein